MDGIEVLKEIRGIPRLAQVPVIILTTSDLSAEMERTIRLGAARYLRKPTSLDDFLNEVGGGVKAALSESPDEYQRRRA
jgi:CheY-like chemotaxis protein